MKVLKLVTVLVFLGLTACKEESVVQSTCYNSGFEVKKIGFQSANEAEKESLVLDIDLETGEAKLEITKDQDSDICNMSLTSAEVQSLKDGLEGPWKICQASASTGGNTTRVIDVQGGDSSEAESIAQPSNSVFQIPQGYDNLEGEILSLVDRIRNQGSCLSGQSSRQGEEGLDYELPELPEYVN